VPKNGAEGLENPNRIGAAGYPFDKKRPQAC